MLQQCILKLLQKSGQGTGGVFDIDFIQCKTNCSTMAMQTPHRVINAPLSTHLLSIDRSYMIKLSILHRYCQLVSHNLLHQPLITLAFVVTMNFGMMV